MTIECHRESCRNLAVWCRDLRQCVLKNVPVFYVSTLRSCKGPGGIMLTKQRSETGTGKFAVLRWVD